MNNKTDKAPEEKGQLKTTGNKKRSQALNVGVVTLIGLGCLGVFCYRSYQKSKVLRQTALDYQQMSIDETNKLQAEINRNNATAAAVAQVLNQIFGSYLNGTSGVDQRTLMLMS